MRTGVLLAAAAALLLPVAVASARSADDVAWKAPTPTTATQFGVPVGSYVTFALAASSSSPVRIRPVGALPAGATFRPTDAPDARAVFRWAPKRTGTFRLSFTASTAGGASAPTVEYAVDVTGSLARYPQSYSLTNRRIARWAVVLRPAVVRHHPSLAARAKTRLATMTSDGTQNLVLV